MFALLAVEVDRTWRRRLAAVLAVTLGTACVLLSLATSAVAMQHMEGMRDGQAPTSSSAAGTRAEPSLGLVDEPPWIASAMTAPVMSGGCESACTMELGATCVSASGLAVITALLLMVRTRRNTFLCELPRTLLRVAPRIHRSRTPWTVPTRFSLCVLRV